MMLQDNMGYERVMLVIYDGSGLWQMLSCLLFFFKLTSTLEFYLSVQEAIFLFIFELLR